VPTLILTVSILFTVGTILALSSVAPVVFVVLNLAFWSILPIMVVMRECGSTDR
jgi:hypothetical protein